MTLYVTGLKFVKSAEQHEAQFVEETVEFEEGYSGDIAYVPEEGDSVIDLNSKTRAAEYWCQPKIQKDEIVTTVGKKVLTKTPHG